MEVEWQRFRVTIGYRLEVGGGPGQDHSDDSPYVSWCMRIEVEARNEMHADSAGRRLADSIIGDRRFGPVWKVEKL